MAPRIDTAARTQQVLRTLDEPQPAVAPRSPAHRPADAQLMNWADKTHVGDPPTARGDGFAAPREAPAEDGRCTIDPAASQPWQNVAAEAHGALFGWQDQRPSGLPFAEPHLEGATRNPATGAMEYYGIASPAGELKLAWNPPSPLTSPNADVKYYQLSYSPDGTQRTASSPTRKNVMVYGPTTSTKTVTGLTPGQRYCFTIRAAYYAKTAFQYTDPATGQQRTATPGTIIMSGYGGGADGRDPCANSP